MGKVELAALVSLALMGVYLAWGVYLLHLRFNRNTEIRVEVEVATFGALIIFYTFEYALLRVWFEQNTLFLALSTFGLALSGLSLYGPMMMSLASHVVVDMVMPSGQEPEATPHFGAAEQKEREEDFEGAFREYHAQALVFPTDPNVLARVADSLVRIERYEEAVEWYERALRLLYEPEKSLMVSTRLVDVFVKHLDREDDAVEVLRAFQRRFQGTEFDALVERRILRLQTGEDTAIRVRDRERRLLEPEEPLE